MSMTSIRVGLRQCPAPASCVTAATNAQLAIPNLFLSRRLSSIAISPSRRLSPSRTTPVALTPLTTLDSITSCRYASTATSTAASGLGARPHASPAHAALDWNTFFRLRTSRRRYSLTSSIVSSIAVTGAAFVFLSTQPEMADEITKLVPMEPVISMGIMTFAATLLGWLIGPVFGNAVWKLFHRSRLPEFTAKERAFFERIKKHRVNPQGASTNNPVPDYYGEKIGSVSGYRRWLKDQRAFNRKKEGTYPTGI